jgi:hypothetical protein
MLDILFITNDPRAENLIEYLKPISKINILHTGDFDQGLHELFEKRPSLLFFQKSIGNVSDETVARHIKSLLGSASPHIILMDGGKVGTGAGKTFFDDCLKLTNSDQQLRQDFCNLMQKYYPSEWNKLVKEVEKAETGPLRPSQLSHIDMQPEEAATPASPEVLPAKTDSAGNPADGSEQRKSPAQTDPAMAVQENFPPDRDNLRPHLLQMPNVGKEDTKPPAHSLEDKSKKRTFAPFLIGILIIFASILLAEWFFPWKYHRTNSLPGSQTRPVTDMRRDTPPSPTAEKNNRRGIPSFIQKEWHVSGYSESHPGWERYLSPELDFRIYRKNELIKALQTIARGKRYISMEQLASVLREYGCPFPKQFTRVPHKDGLTRESSIVPGIAEIVIYRSQENGWIKAFVIEFL